MSLITNNNPRNLLDTINNAQAEIEKTFKELKALKKKQDNEHLISLIRGTNTRNAASTSPFEGDIDDVLAKLVQKAETLRSVLSLPKDDLVEKKRFKRHELLLMRTHGKQFQTLGLRVRDGIFLISKKNTKKADELREKYLLCVQRLYTSIVSKYVHAARKSYTELKEKVSVLREKAEHISLADFCDFQTEEGRFFQYTVVAMG